MKDTYYFSHDYNPTSDPKIQALIGEHGAVGYGLYWRIVEMLHEEGTHKLPCKKYIYLALAKQMSLDVDTVELVINCCIELCELFNSDGIMFWSERVLRNIGKRNEISTKRSEAGKRSAELRKSLASDEQNSTNVEQVPTSVQQNSTKESKVNERKEKKEIKETDITVSHETKIKNESFEKFNKADAWILKVDEQYREIISMFVDYKKSKNQAYKNEKSFMLMANKLISMSNNNPDNAKKIVEQSMINNWAGLFELKQNNNKSYEQTAGKARKKLY